MRKSKQGQPAAGLFVGNTITYIEYFLSTYGFRQKNMNLFTYGKRVYVTVDNRSDYEYITIIPTNRFADTGVEFHKADNKINMYNRVDFQNKLHRHNIHVLEAYIHPRQAPQMLPVRVKSKRS